MIREGFNMTDEKTRYVHNISMFLEKLTDPNFGFNKIYLKMVSEKKAKMLRDSPILEDIVIKSDIEDDLFRYSVISTQPKVILEGVEQAGKTIMLKKRYISIDGDPDLFYCRVSSDQLIPLYINLKNPVMDPNWESLQHDEYPQDDMMNFLARQIGSSDYWYVIKDLMMRGKFQFLLDSFDEADPRIKKMIECGLSNLGELGNNSFIITTRPGSLGDIKEFRRQSIPPAIYDAIKDCLKQKGKGPYRKGAYEEPKKNEKLLADACGHNLPLNFKLEAGKDVHEIVESFSKGIELKRIFEVPCLVEIVGEMLSCIAKEGGVDYLLLNPYVDFYASFFRPKGARQDFRGFQQQIIEARLKHGSMDRWTRNIIPLENILKRLHEKYVHRPYDNDYNNSPIGLMRKQIIVHFGENLNLKGMRGRVINAYVDMVERKMDEYHASRNFNILAEIHFADSYGEDDTKKFARISDVMKTFEAGVSDIIEYIIRMPEAFNRYYRRNPFVFKGENCTGRLCFDFIKAIQKSTQSLEETVKTCRNSGRYDADLMWKGLQEVDSGLILDGPFLGNVQRLIESKECPSEQEIVELASIHVDNYVVLKKLGSGAIKTAFLARNRHSNDEVVLLQIKDSSIDPASKGYKHYRITHPHMSAAQMKEKILEAEFSVTKLNKLMDKRYIALMSPPIEGRVMGKDHFFIQTLGRYEKTLEDAVQKGEVTPEKAVKYFYQLCYALNNCHKGYFEDNEQKNIVHKDLKPDNMGIATDDNLLLSDFGCTSMFSQGADCRYQYPLKLRPPELAYSDAHWKEKGVEFQSDLFTPEANVWSAGAIFYRMLMGKDLIKMKGERAEIGTARYHEQNEEVYKEIHAFGENERNGKVAEVREKYNGNHGEEYGRLLELCLQIDPIERKGALDECIRICKHINPNIDH